MTPEPPSTDYESALLWHAIEGTFVIELRNGAGDLPESSEDEHRRRVARALTRLAEAGYIRAYLAPWSPTPPEIEVPLSPEELARELADEAGWSSDRELLVAFEATDEGRRVHIPEG